MRRMLVACVFIASAVVASPAAADPIAFVVAMKGPVHVAAGKGGAATRAALGRPLERGDKVTVGAGASASLFFSDGNVVELGAGSSITVGGKLAAADKKRVGPGSEVSGEVFAKVSKFITSDSKRAGLVPLSPMRSDPAAAAIILEPRRSSLLSGRPAFAWRAVAGASRYRVTVTGDDGAVWNREVSDTTLAYPGELAPLAEARDYTWDVQALSDAGPIRGEESSFHVLAAGEAEQVRDRLDDIHAAAGDASEAGRFLAGSYLVGRGLYADAARQFRELCGLAPGTPGPHEALGAVYQTVGLTDLAKEELERARVLSAAK